jgi:transposase
VLDVSEFKHFRINYSKLFADKKNHINGIENFCSQAKRHIRKFNGVQRSISGYFRRDVSSVLTALNRKLN